MKTFFRSLFLSIFLAFLGTHMTNVCGKDLELISWDDLYVNYTRGAYNLDNGGNSYRDRVIVVSQDGIGHSLTVQGAVDLVPDHNGERVKIYILPGIYRERVYIPSHKPYISFIGTDPSKTIITYNAKASDKDAYGKDLGTFYTATVDVESNYFCATGITFQNTVVAEPGEKGKQAVALKVAAERALFYKVNIIGSQDTLLDLSGSHYFYKCFIQGSIDFIFGSAKSLYEECVINSTAKRAGAIAASHRASPDEDSGFSFLNCKINGTGKIYLGRAWGKYSRTIYIHCHIDNIIIPEGWHDFGDASRRETVTFGEFRCGGRGAYSRRRVPWSKLLTAAQVKPFRDKSYIDGQQWLSL